MFEKSRQRRIQYIDVHVTAKKTFLVYSNLTYVPKQDFYL